MNLRREILALGWLFLAAFLSLALFSFHPADPSLNNAVSSGARLHNLVGLPGSYLSGILADLFGIGAWALPMLCLYLGLLRFIDALRLAWWRWLGFLGLWICFMAWAAHPWFMPESGQAVHGLSGGGLLGYMLNQWTRTFMRPAGAFLFWLFLSMVSAQLFLGLSWATIFVALRDFFTAYAEDRRARKEDQAVANVSGPDKAPGVRRAAKPAPLDEALGSDIQFVPDEEDEPVMRPFDSKPKPVPPRKTEAKSGRPRLPGYELLAEPPRSPAADVDQKALQAMAAQLVQCLENFNVQGEIQQVVPGPVVTMFEFKPAPGVKISRIAALSDDIALALKATAVRIEAPIPGKDSVGVEIPNPKRQTVYLREILESPAFMQSSSPLTMAIGKNIEGQPQVADLARMPHLLVAGATGAGKSVCLNGILLSFLYKADPDQVKLLLVDPKRIELALYADLPHLVHPVVTDMAMAKNALEWATFEMDSRYEAMARIGARNIEAYNQKLAALGDERPENLADLNPMPYLVIVIDELADLMMTAAKEVEMSIVRLAQLARAAGIHLILATQRPSVDVVTGLIKANFPTRISFQVTSKHDSRTILDTVGAERLLGRGDMLYKPSGSKLQRMHGAFVDEPECAAVVKFWKNACPQRFELDFTEWKKDSGGDGNGSDGGGEGIADDPVYSEALDFVTSQGKASISLIQRKFRIGFNRAARFIEQMERDGILGPAEGSKPRAVIRRD